MEQKKAFVVGAGDFFQDKIFPQKEDFVIAVDGGYRYLQESGVKIDLAIGDFDSLGGKPNHQNVVELPKEKDDTDMLAALKYGLKMGYNKFYIYGGTGGRISHTISNLQCLAFLAQNNARGFMFDEQSVVTAISNGDISFDANHSGYISMISHSDKSSGVSISGLKYELKNADLSNTFPIGVSNEFVGKKSKISVLSGTIIIIYERCENFD